MGTNVPSTEIPGARMSETMPTRPLVPEAFDRLYFLARFDLEPPLVFSAERILTDAFMTVTGSPARYSHAGFRARTVDGSNAYHNVPQALLHAAFPGEVDTDFTLMALFRIPDLSGTFKALGQKADDNANPALFYVETDADYACLLDAGVGRTQAVGYVAGDWAVGGVRYDAATNTVEFIHNGAMVGSFASTTLALNPGEAFNITCRNSVAPNLPFIGQVGWLGVWGWKLDYCTIRTIGTRPMAWLMDREPDLVTGALAM